MPVQGKCSDNIAEVVREANLKAMMLLAMALKANRRTNLVSLRHCDTMVEVVPNMQVKVFCVMVVPEANLNATASMRALPKHITKQGCSKTKMF